MTTTAAGQRTASAGTDATGGGPPGEPGGPSVKQRIQDAVARVRERAPVVDHAVRTVEHYGRRQGSSWAGAVTYFAFLSFFPILALAFAVVGAIARIYPGARGNLVTALDQLLPHLIGNGAGQLSLDTVSRGAGAAAGIGVIAVLYSGLGWISGMRQALVEMFVRPREDQLGFFPGKLRDLLALLTIGVVLLSSVAISGVVTALSSRILHWLSLDGTFGWALVILAILVGLGANMLLFFALFTLLARPEGPRQALWSGAVLGAVGFEVLKQLSRVLLASTARQPAFQAFGIALILVVWIYYFSRVVMYAAAWAYTSPAAREPRERRERDEREQNRSRQRRVVVAQQRSEGQGDSATLGFLGGAALALGAVAAVRRWRRRR